MTESINNEFNSGKDNKCPASSVVFPMYSDKNINDERIDAEVIFKQKFVIGSFKFQEKSFPQISSQIFFRDKWGAFRVRWGWNRMNYKVIPGLYAMGNPDEDSPVLVSANYKMSFDYLRASLSERNAWILVLDTKGVNVWCAAGEGTFGTAELLNKIITQEIKNIVQHRKIILPQLGAPGVAAHFVKKYSGFSVYYGPVEARDIPYYLDNGLKATPLMRQKTFGFRDRLKLIPMEVVPSLKYTFLLVIIFYFIALIFGRGKYHQVIWNNSSIAVLAVVIGLIAGSVIVPFLLPYISGRSFTVKGLISGIICSIIVMAISNNFIYLKFTLLTGLSLVLITSAISAFLAMNFTGASTFTSLSGVKREIRWAVPLEISAGVLGLAIWIIATIFSL